MLVRPGRPLPRDAALVILPGSKATLADLASLRREGWDIDILAHCRRGGHVLGICGGFQMLGRKHRRSRRPRRPARHAAGLGLLDIDTVLGGEKRLVAIDGVESPSGAPVQGYEMHLGLTAGPGLARPMLRLARSRRWRGQRRRAGRRLLSARAVRRRPVPPRLPGAARRRPARSPTRQRSSVCSTGSPIIWKRTSISTGCSPRRARPPQPGSVRCPASNAPRISPASSRQAPVEPQGAADIARRRLRRAVAEPGVVDRALGVLRAARRARGRARRPSPPRANRRSANDAFRRRAA